MNENKYIELLITRTGGVTRTRSTMCEMRDTNKSASVRNGVMFEKIERSKWGNVRNGGMSQMAGLRVFKHTSISAHICLGRVRSVPQMFLLCWFNVQFELVLMLYALCFMWCSSSFSILPLFVYV